MATTFIGCQTFAFEAVAKICKQTQLSKKKFYNQTNPNKRECTSVSLIKGNKVVLKRGTLWDRELSGLGNK